MMLYRSLVGMAGHLWRAHDAFLAAATSMHFWQPVVKAIALIYPSTSICSEPPINQRATASGTLRNTASVLNDAFPRGRTRLL
jgi:hypothetical protein